ncbi:flagellar basal body-associated protein FliL [Colwelliaceae bacterium 6471]
MADDKDKELELDSSGKKKKMIIIIAAVAILVIGGGVAYFFLGGSDSVSEAEINAALDSGEAAPMAATSSANLGTALYIPMPRPFRFNVPGAARDRFVEIRVQLLVRGNSNEEDAKKHVPLIESTLLGIFSTANADDLGTSAGKSSLKQRALVEVQKTMNDLVGKKVVEQVLFTGFVMQ